MSRSHSPKQKKSIIESSSSEENFSDDKDNIAKFGSSNNNNEYNDEENEFIKPKARRYSESEIPPNLSLLELFRYANCFERFLAAIGVLFAIVEGAGVPMMSIVFGSMTNTLANAVRNGFVPPTPLEDNNASLANTTASTTTTTITTTTTTTPSTTTTAPIDPGDPQVASSAFDIDQFAVASMTAAQFEQEMIKFALYYVAIGLAIYISSAIQIYCLQLSGERQIFRIRRKFFANVLRQELSWFDKNQSGALATKLNDDIERIRDGLGDQLSLCIKQAASFFSGFAVGFFMSWRLTLVLLLATPLLALFSAYTGKVFATSVRREQEKYAYAGAIAEEVFVSIRTVFALNGQKSELKAFNNELRDGKRIATVKYIKISAIVGLSMFVLYTTYGLGLYVATILLDSQLISVGKAMATLMSVMMASGALGQMIPPIQVVGAALSSAALIYEIIESEPKIDASKEQRGFKLSKLTPNLKFNDVSFNYPLRPNVPVLSKLNLELRQGETVAICGKTGSGKSTIINLLLRFYDPQSGAIYLDNCKYTDLNVAWLRSLIGIVEQEPALFDCSISDNIALGSQNESQRSYAKILAVAKLANAHDFISNLPDGYATRCGDRGYQMSGGQKQRIAIARALLSDPKILLLDEATSALDSESEAIVQEALNKARKGRTTIVIAHRLSTIKEADTICVMDGGKLIETGKHDELMEAKGHYYNLVTSQVFDDNKSEDETSKQINTTDDSDLDSNNAERSTNYRSSMERTLSVRSSGLLDIESRRNISLNQGKKLSVSTYDSFNKNTHFFNRKQSKASFENGDANIVNDSELTIRDIYYLIRAEWALLSSGFLVASLSGLLMPLFGLMYAQIFQTLTLFGDELFASGKFWSLMFIALAAANMILFFFRIVLIARAIENTTSRLRVECFQSILRQQVGWFDLQHNSPQRLTARLATDVPQIKSIINARLSTFVSGSATIIAALIIAFIISWKMAFLSTALLPILIYVGKIQMSLNRRDRSAYIQNMEDASRCATEAIEHVKLIQAIGQEQYFIDKFVRLSLKSTRETKSTAKKFALIYAVSVSAIYFVYGATFRFGGYLISNNQLDPVSMFRVFFAIAFTAVAVGQWGGLGGDMSRANHAIKNIIKLRTLQPFIDNMGSGGIKPNFRGLVSFQNVFFKYPTRPDTTVLHNMSLTIQPGTTLALVGPSGNGKSTIAALLLRFYDPEQGTVRLDNHDLRCINLEHLRRNVCIVSQEPILFKASIKENILYGLDATRYTMADVRNAAKLANIDDFIINLPQGYETPVGDRGTQMSGGQKQRIAIARAIIRNPVVLILDEATSALDSESEAIVSQALEKATKGKTCIKIAHRLSTIRDADQIAVIEKGAIVELGNHDELMAKGKKGHYYKLMQKQEIHRAKTEVGLE